MLNFILIVLSVFFSWLSQVFFKLWMEQLKNINFLSFYWIKNIFLNYNIIIWLLCMLFSMILWFKVLTKVNLSTAYPFIWISFIIVLIWSIMFLWESINFYKILWTLLILIWVILIYTLWNK